MPYGQFAGLGYFAQKQKYLVFYKYDVKVRSKYQCVDNGYYLIKTSNLVNINSSSLSAIETVPAVSIHTSVIPFILELIIQKECML